MDKQKNLWKEVNILDTTGIVFNKVIHSMTHTLSQINQWLGKKSLKWGFFILLFVLWAPLLKKGYLFMLDRAITPEIAPIDIYYTDIFNIFLYVTQFIFPTWIGEKILWIGIFMLGGCGIIRLYNLFDDQKNDILRVALLAFFWINPFIYARTLDGHLNVITITMILPWLLYFIYNSITNSKSWHVNIGGAILAIFILGGASPHGLIIGLGVVIIVFGISFIVYTFRLSIIKNLLLVIVGGIIVNSRWVIPVLNGETRTSDIMENFNTNHLTAFQTHGARLGIYLNPLALRGYRGEIQKRILEHHNNSTLGRVALFVFWTTIIIGISMTWRKHQKITISALGLIIIAWILGQGNNPTGVFAQFNNFLFNNIPGYMGMRDPQKWISILVVLFAIFASKGVTKSLEIIQGEVNTKKNANKFSWYSNLMIAGFIIVPLFYSSNQLRGRSKQLHVASYPESWTRLKQKFNTVPTKCEIQPCHTLVMFPWHSYMDFSFAQRVITNPLPLFIGKDIVWGAKNVEFGNLIYSQNELSGDIVDEFVGAESGFWWINQEMQNSSDSIERVFLKEKTRQWIVALKKHGVSHFVFLFESDYQKISGLADYLILNGFADSQDIQNEYELLVIK